MTGIYKITNPLGEIYIGKSVDINKRWYQYRLYLAKNQRKLNLSFTMFGIDCHLFEIIEECEVDILNSREHYFIVQYKSFDQLNCNTGNKKDRPKEFFDRKVKRIEKRKAKIKNKKVSMRKGSAVGDRMRGRSIEKRNHEIQMRKFERIDYSFSGLY